MERDGKEVAQILQVWLRRPMLAHQAAHPGNTGAPFLDVKDVVQIVPRTVL